LLDISYRADRPGSVLVYADGADARVLQKLIDLLGSEERAHNALILTGYLDRIQKKKKANKKVNITRKISRVKNSFPALVGVSYEDFIGIYEEEF
jgi:hypothetical protein